MLKLITGVATAAFLMLAPGLAKSEEVPAPDAKIAPVCVPGSALQSRYKAEMVKQTKQVWMVTPGGLAKINKFFGTSADTAFLVYFGGQHFGFGLWACGNPLQGYAMDLTYGQMKALMEKIELLSTDAVQIKGIDA